MLSCQPLSLFNLPRLREFEKRISKQLELSSLGDDAGSGSPPTLLAISEGWKRMHLLGDGRKEGCR
jgi:hypothetical protein